jgi:hypothetical protein
LKAGIAARIAERITRMNSGGQGAAFGDGTARCGSDPVRCAPSA